MLRLLRTSRPACVGYAYLKKAPIKFVAAVLAMAIASSAMTVSAFAQNPQNNTGILPGIFGPAAVAALVGTSTTTWSTVLTKKFFFYKYNPYGWKKVFYLKRSGFDIDLYKKHKFVKVKASKTEHHTSQSKSDMGKAVVGCVMGSALAAITSSIRKASAMGNPPSWRSQAEHEAIVASGSEKQFELTNDESQTALSFCGLGSLALNWP